MSQNAPTILYCVNHPDRETLLRCNRCERPICPECAVLTPTGYRCKDCVRNQQKVFDTAQWFDYPLAVIIAGVLSFLGSLIANLLGFFTLFVAPVAGSSLPRPCERQPGGAVRAGCIARRRWRR